MDDADPSENHEAVRERTPDYPIEPGFCENMFRRFLPDGVRLPRWYHPIRTMRIRRKTGEYETRGTEATAAGEVEKATNARYKAAITRRLFERTMWYETVEQTKLGADELAALADELGVDTETKAKIFFKCARIIRAYCVDGGKDLHGGTGLQGTSREYYR